MLLHEKIETYSFSSSEQSIIEYILKEKDKIKNKTIKEIAQENYVAPSTLIRIAKKLGFDGWNSFKDAYLEEADYLNRNFQDVNANIPFNENDDFITISNKLMHLNTEAIKDTNSLLDRTELENAVKLMSRSGFIHVFGISGNLLISQDFQIKMS